MNGRQVAVCVGKGWVDLDGSGVAVQGTLHILHLFESVTHVRVGIGKIGVDSTQKAGYAVGQLLGQTNEPQQNPSVNGEQFIKSHTLWLPCNA